MPSTSFGFGGGADFQQPMQTGGYQQQPQKLTAQPTGFISSLSGSQDNTMTIPQIRLSFITARDQERFEQIFRSQVPAGENSMNSSTAKNILMKSNLTAVQLLNIWELADTNRSGSLMFPEFCIALHLANLARRGESIPRELPLKMKNEVTGFVDALNFEVGMKSNQNETQQAANSFMSQEPPTSFMQSQQTGYMQPQQTGYMQPQQTGLTPLAPQQTAGLVPFRTGQQQQQPQFGISNGLQPQPTGFFNQLLGQPTGAPLMAQATGSAPPMTSFAAQPTGGLMPQMTGLQPMPTGRPGQWGFVSAPTGGLPGLDMMQSHFMPNAQTQVGNLQTSMGGNNAENLTWAISKQEKVIYDDIFKQWDKERNGYVNGDVAIDVFSKSGLAFADLESIWTLSDGGNKGKLNKDEFAVAMHLIYRRLNGFNIPNVLPPELIPPSSKMLENSVDAMKNTLKRQAAERNSIANNSSPANGAVSGSAFKNNDDDIQYVSKSRRGRVTNSKTEDAFSDKLSLDDLQRQIREKKILLAAIDAEDEERSSDYGKQKTMNEIEMFKTKIKSIQSDLNQKLGAGNVGSIEEREQLSAKLNSSADKVPKLIDAIAAIDEQIKNGKIEQYRLQLEKENPSGFEIRGTGPNGEITERDRRIAKQKAEVQVKMARLTGKQAPNFEAYETNESMLSQEIVKFTAEAEEQKSIVKDLAVSITSLISDISGSLNLSNSMTVGYQKWEHKDGVQNQEVKDFIDYLNSTKPASAPSRSVVNSKPVKQASASASAPASAPSRAATATNGPTPAEERAKKIKEDAQRRMNERLAKLGIKRKPQQTEEPAAVEPEVATPEPVVRSQPPPPPNRGTKPKPEPEVQEEDSSSSSDSEDEELKLLMAKKKQLEERKKKKKLEKEERIAKLKAEMEALEGNESDDSWDEPKKSEKTVPAASANTDHSNNPFASMLGKKEEPVVPEAAVAKTVEAPIGSHNPFAKPTAPLTSTPTGTPIDANKLQAQRAAQMGTNGSNDDWSDSGDDGSEDEMPVGAKQAEIASMLFGGSGNPTRSNTFIPNEQEKKVEEKVEEPVEVPAVPAVPEAPVVTESAPVFPPPVPESAPVFPPPVPETEPVVEREIEEPAAPVMPPPLAPEIESVPLVSQMESGNNSEFFDAQSDASSFMASSPEMMAHAPEVVPEMPVDGPPPLPTAAVPPPPPMAPPLAPPLAPPMPPLAPIAPTMTGGMPNLSNLLGEISLGTALKRVASGEQHIADGATVGRVIE